MRVLEPSYVWSAEDWNESRFSSDRFSTPEAALKAAMQEAPRHVRVILVGRILPTPKASSFLPDMDFLIDSMVDRARDQYDEPAETWLDELGPQSVGDLRVRLEAAIDAWADAQGVQPEFSEVETLTSTEVHWCDACERLVVQDGHTCPSWRKELEALAHTVTVFLDVERNVSDLKDALDRAEEVLRRG